jgi:hypothetical protein
LLELEVKNFNLLYPVSLVFFLIYQLEHRAAHKLDMFAVIFIIHIKTGSIGSQNFGGIFFLLQKNMMTLKKRSLNKDYKEQVLISNQGNAAKRS